jgi:hypothetical protein
MGYFQLQHIYVFFLNICLAHRLQPQLIIFVSGNDKLSLEVHPNIWAEGEELVVSKFFIQPLCLLHLWNINLIYCSRYIYQLSTWRLFQKSFRD